MACFWRFCKPIVKLNANHAQLITLCGLRMLNSVELKGDAMNNNLTGLSKEEMDKVSAGLAAGTVAVRERNNLPVNADEVEMEQPEHLRAYFRERLAHYRQQPAKK